MPTQDRSLKQNFFRQIINLSSRFLALISKGGEGLLCWYTLIPSYGLTSPGTTCILEDNKGSVLVRETNGQQDDARPAVQEKVGPTQRAHDSNKTITGWSEGWKNGRFRVGGR